MGVLSRTSQRLAVVTAIVVGATLLSEPALAQTPLLSTGASQATPQPPSLTEQATAPVVQATEPLAQATAPASTATAPTAPATQPVQQAVEPVVQAAAPVVAQATAPASELSAPLREAVEPTIRQATEPVVAAAEPALEQLPATAPVLDAAEPLVSPATRAASTVLSPAMVVRSPAGQTAGPSSSEQASAAASSVSASTEVGVTGSSPDPPASRDPRTAPQRLRAGVLPSAPPPGSSAMTTDTQTHRGGEARHVAEATRPRTQAPGELPHPLGIAGAISAAFGSSSALLFLAALAASLFLAASGAGRRLRPALAPWPLPIPLASLERPG